jgi:HSP20 family protein
MTFRDLIPWNRGRDVAVRRSQEANPFLMLHREMNRVFDDAFGGFDLAPFGGERAFSADRGFGWPSIEVSETNKDVTVTAELPGLDEKDVEVELANGVLVIRGEKKTETEDKDRRFSERFYGRFERHIPVEDVEEDKVSASFKNGVLAVTLPKSPNARRDVKRITIHSN